jgi:hypothetical protein
MSEIFISHIHEEKDQANALRWYLRDRLHVDAFLTSDMFQLLGGEEWLQRIRRELQTCRIVLSVLSRKSVKRPWINFEAGAAWVTNKPVIPCCHGGLRKGSLPQPFAAMHAFEMPSDLYPLVVAVYGHLNPGHIPPPPSLPDGLQDAVMQAFESGTFIPPLTPMPPGFSA